MIESNNVLDLALLAISLVVTMINTVIIATTRAAVSELKANLIEKLASRADLNRLDDRVRRIESATGMCQLCNNHLKGSI